VTNLLKDCLGELAEEVRVVDMYDRVLRGSRRITVRNRVVASLAAIVAMSGAAVGAAAVRPALTPPPLNQSATPSATPAIVDIRDAIFEVPEFPGRDGWCGAAKRWFGKGRVQAGGRSDDPILLRMIGDPVRADIDGVPGDEILLEMECYNEGRSRGQVLAVKVGPDGRYTSMGFVLNSADHATFLLHNGTLRVEGGTILIDLLGPNYDGVPSTLDLQTRGYAYRHGEFVQVSGPTAFALPPGDYHRVDFRNVTTCVMIPHYRNQWAVDYVRTTDGKSTVTLDGVRYEVTVLSSAVFFSGSPWGMALYRLHPAFGPEVTVANLYLMYKPMPCAYDIVMVDGIDGATKAEMSGSDLKVTVGGEVRTFRKADGGLRWVSSA